MILKNNLNSVHLFKTLVLLSIFSTLLVTTKIISYKIVYFFQIFCFFFLAYKYKFIKINKIFFFNLFVLTILLFNYNREMVYLITLCMFSSLIEFKKEDLKKIQLDLKYIIFYLFIVLYFLESYGNNLSILEVMEDRNFFPICCFRMEYFSLNANLTSVLLLSISVLLLSNLNKNKFLIYFFITGALILYLTSSKSGTLLFIFYLLLIIFNIKRFKIFMIFILINFLLIFSSMWLVKNFDSPYESKNRVEQVQVYKKICENIDNKLIKYFSNCLTDAYKERRKGDDPKNYVQKNNIINFLGMASYYKFYTYGLTIQNIKENYKYFIFPNGLEKLLNEKKITYKQIKNDFSAHSFILQSIHKYGFVYFIFLIINLYYIYLNYKNMELFMPFLISSTFLSLDIMLFFPIIILQIYLANNYVYKKN